MSQATLTLDCPDCGTATMTLEGNQIGRWGDAGAGMRCTPCIDRTRRRVDELARRYTVAALLGILRW